MRRIVVAGAVFGFSLAISLKAVLLAPLFISLIFTDRLRGASRHSAWANWNIDRLMVFTASAAIFGITVLFFHWLTLSSVDPGAVGGFATGVARKTLFSGSLFPRWDYFSQTLDTDWLCWVYIFAGLPVAIFHSKRAALCLLALFPVVVYRNAFPYYYVVMLAPAAVLAALAIDTLTNWASKYSRASTLGWIPLAASMPLLLQTAINLSMLRSDGQELQRLTLAAVHKIFPEPVPYIDHSGMVSSFPKQNFFMSSWAIENYVAAGKGFMREAMASRPPLLLANSPFLSPGSPLFDLLLEEDRRLIENFYVNYWGAINIAGAAVDLNSAVDVIVELPFPGRYRLVADEDVLVDGSIREDGSIIEISENDEATQVTMRRLGGHLITAKLLWAGAGPEPPGYLPRLASLYSGL